MALAEINRSLAIVVQLEQDFIVVLAIMIIQIVLVISIKEMVLVLC